MDWNVIVEFVRPELLILIAVCYCLGLFLKGIPKCPDWIIPISILGFSIIVAPLYLAVVVENTFTWAILLLGIFYGIICAAIAVFGNQVVKQLGKRKEGGHNV